MINFSTVSDEDLYSMCTEGDEGAWQYIYNYILTICKWRKWNLRDEPEEIAQQVTLHLIEKALKKVKEKTKFRHFVKTMTINKIKDSFKKRRHEEYLDEIKTNKKGEEFVPEYANPGPSHDNVLMKIEMVSVIEKAIDALSSACSNVVREYLNFKMGLYKDYKELSKVLKMPVPTISSKVRRCLDKLLQSKEIKEVFW